MKDRMIKILKDFKNQNVDYADIRLTNIISEKIQTKNIELENVELDERYEIGIRVLYNGSIGFAGSYDLDNLEVLANKALQIAKSSNDLQKKKISIIKDTITIDNYFTEIKIDPFKVPLDEKTEILFNCAKRALLHNKISTVYGSMFFSKEEKTFLDINGSFIEQTIYKSGANIEVEAKSENETQVRNYPNSYGGNISTSGFEYILDLNLLDNIDKIANEASDLLDAEECPNGIFDVIIDPDQLAIQIHESIGHAVELDRIMGFEISLAGGSFVKTEFLNNNYQYGSNHVNIVSDSTLKGAVGTYGYDDDGIKAQKTYIIKEGVLLNLLTSIETSNINNIVSNGQNIADGGINVPIVRMTNLNLKAGDFTLKCLISKVKYGLYLKTNKSWSIDDKRINFQFGCEIAYEIIDGKFSGKIYKNPIYSGKTTKFWHNCEGVSNNENWKMYCAANCGKGLPYQDVNVGHGSSPTLFRNIKVGV